MDTPEDISKPSQLDKPVRPRRVRPVYPESPIVIPPDREEAAKDALSKVHELWEQGRHLDSLLEWFDLPKDKRDDAINSVILQEGQIDPDRSLKSAQDDTKGKPENLILEHYALFSTDAVGKIIRPGESEPITIEDTYALGENPGTEQGIFYRNLMRLGLRSIPLFNDMGDFTAPKEEIQGSFSLEEERELLIKLVPYLSDEVKFQLLATFGLIHPIKHADLLTDTRLTDALEKPLLKGISSWATYLENYIAQDGFPSAEFFELAFKRLDTKDSNPNANFHISVEAQDDTEVPASAFYFTMLRKIVHLKEWRESDPEYLKDGEEKFTSYLLSDAFMNHVLPYFDTDNAYEDDFVSGLGKLTFHNAKVIATGEEARRIKRERVGEVIKTAIDYARQKGDEQTVQRLTEREIAGIKFSDFLN